MYTPPARTTTTARETLPPRGEDEYYAFQLVGLAVEEEGGRFLGHVREVLDYPANDVLELDTGRLVFANAGHNLPMVASGGTVTELDLQPDGLYAVIAANERGQRVLESNPGLGVSARIVEQYARSDGEFFPAAIQHVLATLDPRIPGLGAWQPVDLSYGDDDVRMIDLSAGDWIGIEPAATPYEVSVADMILAELETMTDAELQELELEGELKRVAVWARTMGAPLDAQTVARALGPMRPLPR